MTKKLAVKRELNEELIELIQNIDDKIISLSKNKGKVTDDDFRWAFKNALTFEEYLRTFKERLAASATAYAPAALDAVGRKAAAGDVKAAQVVFNMLGALEKAGGSGAINMTQVNVNVPTLRDLEEGKVIDA